jgi:hypothetical protein
MLVKIVTEKKEREGTRIKIILYKMLVRQNKKSLNKIQEKINYQLLLNIKHVFYFIK